MIFLMFVLPYTNGGYFLIKASDTNNPSASGYDYVEEETSDIPGCQAKKLSSGVACVKKSRILSETGEKSDPNCVKQWIRKLSTKLVNKHVNMSTKGFTFSISPRRSILDSVFPMK